MSIVTTTHSCDELKKLSCATGDAMLRENYHELKCDKLVSKKHPLTSWLKRDALVSKKYPLTSWKRKKRAPGPCRTESAVLDCITKPSYVYPLRIQIILRTQFIGSGAFANVRGRRRRRVAHRTPRQAYTCTNFPECRLHSCVEQKAVSLLATLTVSGWFIIKFLTCRRRSCFMFMVSSRYFLSRRRKENVCLQRTSLRRVFVKGICEAGLAEILKKNNFYKW